jgi:hypothetical protein
LKLFNEKKKGGSLNNTSKKDSINAEIVKNVKKSPSIEKNLSGRKSLIFQGKGLKLP